MKKILLASTALIASASVAAAADVKIKVDGYYGVGYGTYGDDGVIQSNSSGSGRDYGFVYDLDINFSATGDTDSGLVFGFQTDLDDNALGSQGPRGWDGEIFVSGDFGRLAMGDIDGGAEKAVGDLHNVGMTDLGDGNEFAFLLGASTARCTADTAAVTSFTPTGGAAVPGTFNSATGQVTVAGTTGTRTCGSGPVARYDYTYDGLLLSFGMNDDEGYAVGVGYDGGFWNVGLGYESIQNGALVELTSSDSGFDASTVIVDSAGRALGASFVTTDDASQVIAQAGLTLAGVDLKAIYGELDFNEAMFDGAKQYGVSAGYGFDAFSVAAYWRRVEIDRTGANADTDNDIYGLGFAYALGGGLALEGGVAQYDYENATEKLTVADFGIAFDF